MNASRTIITLVKRSYGVQKRWTRQSNPGMQKRLDLLEDDRENDVELMENLDTEPEEPDFMQAHQSYKSHKNELAKNKELLKLRIVTRKYFNQVEPSMLTYIEKEQIRFLHDSDPLEYTPEKLSESFPALPHVIRKILRTKWTPRSADRVIKHDQHVIENWKKFKLGELPLEPRLREHLQKFKGRRISLPNKAELEKKLIPPEKTFVKPKSQLYTGIIQSYLDRGKDDNSNGEEATLSVPEKKDADFEERFNTETLDYKDLMDRSRGSAKNDLISKPKFGNEVAILGGKELAIKTKTIGAKAERKDFFTLDEFLEDKVKNMDGTDSIEDRVLMDTYKKKIESEIGKEDNIVRENRLRAKDFGESDSVTVLTEEELPSAIEKRRHSGSAIVVDDSKEMGMETYVKIWEKKASQDNDYPETIKIPKSKYQEGKLYKLKDCYYDSDGEFLFRVPGLRE